MFIAAAGQFRPMKSCERLLEGPHLAPGMPLSVHKTRFKSLRAKRRSFVILSICPLGGDVAFLKKESFMTAFLYPSVLILNSSEN